MKKGLKITLIVLGVLMGIGVINAAVKSGKETSAKIESGEIVTDKITLSKFNKIEIGMNIFECEKIMGKEGELTSESDIGGMKMQAYSFNNWDGAGCILTFTDGKLDTKVQAMLK